MAFPKTPDTPIGAALVRMVVISTAGVSLPRTQLVVIQTAFRTRPGTATTWPNGDVLNVGHGIA